MAFQWEYPFCLEFADGTALARAVHQSCVAFLTDLLAHEFNNALTGLSGYAQMAVAMRKETIYHKAAEAFDQGTRRLQELARHIQFFARESVVDLCPCDPNTSADLVQSILEHHLSRRDITLQFPQRSSKLVFGNSNLLATGLMAYVLEARDRLMPLGGKGEITILFHEETNHLRIVCFDSGTGPSALFPPLEQMRLCLDRKDSDSRPFLARCAFPVLANLFRGTLQADPEFGAHAFSLRLGVLGG